MKELDNTQIDSFFRDNPFYGGCFSKNEITRVNGNDKKFYILNMDTPSGGGTHWVLLSMINPEIAIYFDSFSVEPPTLVELYMKRNRKEALRNNGTIQSLTSQNCGYFCCRTGLELSEGKNFLDILDEYSSNENENERIITQWAKRVKLYKP